jgi:glutamate--cysteine ligase
MTGRVLTYRLPPSVDSPDAPVESRDQLVGHLAAGESPDAPSLLGVELELLPMQGDGQAAPFEGRGGVEELLRALAEGGLEAVEAEGHVIGLRADAGAVHLEPGAQVELALAPRARARDVLDDLLSWRALLASAAAGRLHLVPLGLQPVTPVRDITWIPRNRYRLMSTYLSAQGTLGHHMMKATAGTQLTVDYRDEANAVEIVECALALAPVVNALCANSPLEEGQPNGFLTKRPHVWANTDPARTGVLPWVAESGFSYDRYVEWALDAPVIFVLRDGLWMPIGDRTFRQFLDAGHPEAGPARHEDFVLHLTTLFPEVRVKQHIEIRGADSCPPEFVAAVAALWRGLLYHPGGATFATELTHEWTIVERQQLHDDAGRLGLRARIRGRSMADIALDVLDCAASGLLALDGPTSRDVPLLAPLRLVAESGETLADILLREWPHDGAAALLRHA